MYRGPVLLRWVAKGYKGLMGDGQDAGRVRGCRPAAACPSNSNVRGNAKNTIRRCTRVRFHAGHDHANCFFIFKLMPSVLLVSLFLILIVFLI